MNRLIKNGMVAVIISPGYGAGWSSWCSDYPAADLAMDAELAQAVLDGDVLKVQEVATSKFPKAYKGGLYDTHFDESKPPTKLIAEIEWVPVGAEFRIDEYDGAESLEYRWVDEGWLRA